MELQSLRGRVTAFLKTRLLVHMLHFVKTEVPHNKRPWCLRFRLEAPPLRVAASTLLAEVGQSILCHPGLSLQTMVGRTVAPKDVFVLFPGISHVNIFRLYRKRVLRWLIS